MSFHFRSLKSNPHPTCTSGRADGASLPVACRCTELNLLLIIVESPKRAFLVELWIILHLQEATRIKSSCGKKKKNLNVYVKVVRT